MKGLTVGTAAFDRAWKAEATKDPEGFLQAQHDFVAGTHYQPGVNKIKEKTGLDVSTRSKAVQDVVWSVSVQHGSAGAGNLFKNAGVNDKMTDKEIIDAVYKERSKVNVYFKSSPQNIKNSVYNRFQQEWKDALQMLNG